MDAKSLPEAPTEEQEEYERATKRIGAGVVSQKEYNADKIAIMNAIKDLDSIMKSRDYKKWAEYLTPDSIAYWTNPRNLAAVTNRLPIKGLKIQSISDYFSYIFIPARLDKNIDEIRYISPALTRAVEAQEGQDIIYYTFEKINEKWLIKLDTLE